MLSIQTILVPTDFSGSSADALAVAACLARQTGARLILLHVMGQPVFLEGAGFVPFDLEMYRNELRDKLEQQAVRYPGIEIERQLAEGKPVAEILHAAENRKCDLIVMGTFGASGLRRLLMGSVAEGVARKAACAVLTVRAPLSRAVQTPEPAQAVAQ